MGFEVKFVIVALLVFSSAFAVVSISSDKPSYHCGFDVNPGVYACEPVKLTIHASRFYHDVRLVLPYDYKNGEISSVLFRSRRFRGGWHHGFFGQWFDRLRGEERSVDLSSFNLYPGDNVITLTPVAHGDFKWDAVLLDARGSELSVLDPWFNTSFQYRQEISNLTMNFSFLKINYNSNMQPDFSDLRFVNASDEQLLNFTFEKINNSNYAYVRVLNPYANDTIYMYYGNTTPVSSNGSLNTAYWEPTTAHWLDENATDFISGVNGVVNGPILTTGFVNGSYSFDGVNDYVNTSEVAPFPNGTGDWSASFIFKTNNVTGYHMFIDGGNYGADAEGVGFEIIDGVLFAGSGILSAVGSLNRVTYSPINIGSWYRVVFVRNSSGNYLYFNGTLVNSSSNTGAPVVNAHNINFGYRQDDNAHWFDGVLDDVMFWNSSLTDEQVKLLSMSNQPNAVFGSEESYIGVDIFTPENGSEVFSQNVKLFFTVQDTNVDYNIYVDSVLNKTVNVTSTPWTEYFNMTEGTHNMTVTLASNESVNDTVEFTAKNFIIESVEYNSMEYELRYSTFNATIKHLENLTTQDATLYYYNGTNTSTSYSMTITNHNATTDYATVTVFTPFIGADDYKYYNFTVNATANDTSTNGYNNTQKIIIGYYISNTTATPTTIVEGGIITSNITVTMKTNYAVVTAYSTLNATVTQATEQSSNGEQHYWESSFHVPSANTSTDFNVTYYITVSYGGVTATRQYDGYDTITVKPISLGYCDATNTVQILNYSLWDEDNHDTQLPISGGQNEWEARVAASAPNGTVTKTYGFKNTTQNLVICTDGSNLSLNTSVWAWDNASNFVKRSHFMLNHLVSNTLEHIKIRTLNASLASVIDFYDYDIYGNPMQDRIIKFYKYYPETDSYDEIFNLITDVQGHATAKLKAYDTWYRIIVIDADGVIRRSIPITQISSSTLSITEESTTETSYIYDVSQTVTWNNASRVLTAYVSSANTHEYKLVTEEIGIWSNTTYCEDYLNGTTGTLFCDLSNSTVSSFQWTLMVKYDGEWVGIANGIEKTVSKPYGFMGLFATALLVMAGSLIFYEPRKRLIGGMAGLTVAWFLQLVVVSWYAVMGLWFAVGVIIYVTRGES